MHHRTDATQLLGNEPPAGRRLQANLELLTTKPLTEPPHPGAVRRGDPRPRDLARVGIDPLHGDLRSMLIKTHHNRHLQRLLTLHALRRPNRARTEKGLQANPDGSPAHAIYQVTPVVLGRRRATRHSVSQTTSRQKVNESARRQPENQPERSDVTTLRE